MGLECEIFAEFGGSHGDWSSEHGEHLGVNHQTFGVAMLTSTISSSAAAKFERFLRSGCWLGLEMAGKRRALIRGMEWGTYMYLQYCQQNLRSPGSWILHLVQVQRGTPRLGLWAFDLWTLDNIRDSSRAEIPTPTTTGSVAKPRF
jgi:hypothetical protein